MSINQTSGLLATSKKTWVAWCVGSIVFIAFIVLVEMIVGWTHVLSLWANIEVLPFFAAFIFFALSHFLRAYRIAEFTFLETKKRYKTTTKLCLIHQFFNNLLPMRLGEAFFPLLLKRYFGIRLLEGAGSLFWLRLLDGGLVLTLFLLCFIWAFDWHQLFVDISLISWFLLFVVLMAAGGH